MHKIPSRIALVLALAGVSASCASTTVINSDPSGAKIYADGSYLGKTPYTYSDTKIVGAVTQIQLKKKGCKTTTVALNRSEQFQVGACIGGVLVLVPFLWIMGYNPSHTYALECKGSKKSEDEDESEDEASFSPEIPETFTASLLEKQPNSELQCAAF